MQIAYKKDDNKKAHPYLLGDAVTTNPHLIKIMEVLKEGRNWILRIEYVLKSEIVIEAIEGAKNIIEKIKELWHKMFFDLPDFIELNGIRYRLTQQPLPGKEPDRVFYMDNISNRIIYISEHERMRGAKKKLEEILKKEYFK